MPGSDPARLVAGPERCPSALAVPDAEKHPRLRRTEPLSESRGAPRLRSGGILREFSFSSCWTAAPLRPERRVDTGWLNRSRYALRSRPQRTRGRVARHCERRDTVVAFDSISHRVIYLKEPAGARRFEHGIALRGEGCESYVALPLERLFQRMQKKADGAFIKALRARAIHDDLGPAVLYVRLHPLQESALFL